MHNKSLKHRAFGTGQFLRCAFVKFAAQIFITKAQHKNCRLARRYKGSFFEIMLRVVRCRIRKGKFSVFNSLLWFVQFCWFS
jgi:hypothetical protein